MPVKPNEQLKSTHVIELKAGAFTLPVLRLLKNQPEGILRELQEKVDQAPDMFQNAPLALDISSLPNDVQPSDLSALVNQIASMGIKPIGVRGGTADQQRSARHAGLAVLSESRPEPKPAVDLETVKATAVEQPAATPALSVSTEAVASRLVELPVRSGQRIYARDADLIILSTVSAGAEIMADGNIHVYGTLRGRALAGVKGNLKTRIFCSDLQAELVSISGQYQVSDGIDNALSGKPVQIYLSGESLVIEEL
jgi:septum site-determining protein MinC